MSSSLIQAFRNLSPKTRGLVGVGIIAWGTIGLYVSDVAEKKLGYEASEEDKKALRAALPSIVTVEREDGKS